MDNKRISLLRFAVSFVLLLAAYIPTFIWMYDRWTLPESYYSHGFFIPLVSLFIIWQRRDLLAKISMSTDMRGLFIVISGLLVHTACIMLNVFFMSGFTFIFVLYGLVLFIFGKEFTRNLIFPVFFLAAMVPLPLVLISNMTVQLKLIAAECATFVLNSIGFRCILDGSTIRMPNSFSIVGAPCSGLRSLIALITLGVLFAYALKVSYLKKAVLLLSTIPIALATNVMRITLIAAVNDLYGEKVAMGFFHDFSGFLVFAVAFVSLYGVSRLLEGAKEVRM